MIGPPKNVTVQGSIDVWLRRRPIHSAKPAAILGRFYSNHPSVLGRAYSGPSDPPYCHWKRVTAWTRVHFALHVSNDNRQVQQVPSSTALRANWTPTCLGPERLPKDRALLFRISPFQLRLRQPLARAQKSIASRLLVGFVVLAAASCDPSTNKPSPFPPCRKPSGDLHVAAAEGDPTAIEALIDRGAAVDGVDALGWTALHWAAEAGRVEATATLLDRAADPNAPDGIGMTPLHWAAMRGRAKLVELLLSHGARVDSRNRNGMTPLHYAANRHVVEALIGGGADVKAIDEQGRSPLHTVRNSWAARALLEAGADVRIRAAHGRTAFESMVIDEIKEKGLIFIFENSTIRLRGDRVRFSVAALNVSICEIRELALVVRSPAAWALVRPRKLPRLAPGEMKNIAIDFDRRPETAEGKHPVEIQIALGRTGAGDLKLTVDTRKRELPTDRGVIRLGKGVLRPASRPEAKYLPFLAIPLIVIAYWFWRRFRKH